MAGQISACVAGIYLLAFHNPQPAFNARDIAALANSSIDGAYIREPWQAAEPQPHVFDWSYMDTRVAALAERHKVASISFTAGRESPEWLYGMGAQGFHTVVETARRRDYCQPVTVPIPWDPVFLKSWLEFVRAAGAHYANNPTVVAVKITGINSWTDEIKLPKANSSTANRPDDAVASCVVPNDEANWAREGYSSAKMAKAFRVIADEFGAAFPRQALGMMLGTDSLPGLEPNLAVTNFIPYARARFGARFVAQNNGLRADKLHDGIGGFGHPLAFQQAWPATGDRNCTMNGRVSPCDPATVMRKALANAEGAGAEYVELMAADIDNPEVAAVLSQAHSIFRKKHDSQCR